MARAAQRPNGPFIAKRNGSHRRTSIFIAPGGPQTRRMDIFLTTEFWTALGAIIVIDLVLAGDNAILIPPPAPTLPKDPHRRPVVSGTLRAPLAPPSRPAAVLS